MTGAVLAGSSRRQVVNVGSYGSGPIDYVTNPLNFFDDGEHEPLIGRTCNQSSNFDHTIANEKPDTGQIDISQIRLKKRRNAFRQLLI